MQKPEHQGAARVGSYEIVRPLARGGMAELFLARVAGPQTFEKLVVVKKILPKFADNPRFVQLFTDEAKLATSLSHKNIVAVHDLGGAGSELFFAMEYVHGQDVRSILHRAWRNQEKLPIEHAVSVAKQVAEALHYAHEKRRPDGTLLEIVHRDVSPSNVLVSYDGAVKLVDFGVAKAATRTVKTRTGTLKGKISYMSPEQAKGATIDRRSDVFSLGIVLWEMVTTARLFRGENDLATLQLIINQPIKRPTIDRPDCPAALERVVLKALAQDADKRYQTALEVARDLEEVIRVEQLPQSAGGLSVYMSGLFRAELDSWESARAHGVQLGDHLTAVGDLTTPISESDFVEALDPEDLEDEEDDDPDESIGAVSGTIEPTATATVPGRRVATPAGGSPNAAIPRAITHQGSGSVRAPIVTQVGTGPVGPIPPQTGSGPVVRPAPPQRPSTPIVRADETPIPVAAQHAPRGDTTAMVSPLPPPADSPWPSQPGLAQGSWPRNVAPVAFGAGPEDPAFSFEQARKLKQQFVYGGAALVGLVLLIAIIKGIAGGGPSDSQAAAKPDAAVEEVAPADAAPTPVKSAEPPPPPPPIDAGVTEPAAPPDAPEERGTKPAVKQRPTQKKPVQKKPPGRRVFDPNSPLPPQP